MRHCNQVLKSSPVSSADSVGVLAEFPVYPVGIINCAGL